MGDVIDFPMSPAAWCVKIRRFAESFWVKVEGEELGTLWGTVNNHLATPRLAHGAPICFERWEVIDEMNRPEETK